MEVNMGQMVKDVRLAVNGKVPVEFFGKPVGTPPTVEETTQKLIETMSKSNFLSP
jgi:2-oxoglutarate ferredoxin oxidoreductase subunit alpha